MTARIRLGLLFGAALGAVALCVGVGCSDDADGDQPGGRSYTPPAPGEVPPPGSVEAGPVVTPTFAARATIASTAPDGGAVPSGTVDFEELGDGKTKVTIKIAGGVPGDHGLHIHENPSCADGGAGAGSHWNPSDAGHGFPTSPVHHVGDLGNVLVNSDGTGSNGITSTEFYVKDGALSVLNHAVVYHDQHDDGTQPAGNSGARIGCGVIQKK